MFSGLWRRSEPSYGPQAEVGTNWKLAHDRVLEQNRLLRLSLQEANEELGRHEAVVADLHTRLVRYTRCMRWVYAQVTHEGAFDRGLAELLASAIDKELNPREAVTE